MRMTVSDYQVLRAGGDPKEVDSTAPFEISIGDNIPENFVFGTNLARPVLYFIATGQPHGIRLRVRAGTILPSLNFTSEYQFLVGSPARTLHCALKMELGRGPMIQFQPMDEQAGDVAGRVFIDQVVLMYQVAIDAEPYND